MTAFTQVHPDTPLADRLHLRLVFAAVAIEHHQGRAGFYAQHMCQMMRGMFI